MPGQKDAAIPAAAGIGLRFPHHGAVLEQQPRVAWLEVHPENYMGGGSPLAFLERIRRDYPVALHGVALSLGSADGIDRAHLAHLQRLVARLEPGFVSEHVAWTADADRHYAELLPLPLTEEALAAVSANIELAQETLGRRLLVENPSTYLRYRHSTMPEWEFIGALARRTGCGLLCDVNNIFVSARNHGFDPRRYLRELPRDLIGEIHLAGHTVRDLGGGRSIHIDDHGSPVPAEVWALYAEAIALFGPVPTLIEWDNNLPALEILVGEAGRAERMIAAEAARARAA